MEIWKLKNHSPVKFPVLYNQAYHKTYSLLSHPKFPPYTSQNQPVCNALPHPTIYYPISNPYKPLRAYAKTAVPKSPRPHKTSPSAHQISSLAVSETSDHPHSHTPSRRTDDPWFGNRNEER